MDAVHILARVAFGYAFAFAVIRASGKRTINQADSHSFVLAIIVGDLFDDLFWAEVPAAEFIVAVSTLVLLHLFAGIGLSSAGRRTWRYGRDGSGA